MLRPKFEKQNGEGATFRVAHSVLFAQWWEAVDHSWCVQGRNVTEKEIWLLKSGLVCHGCGKSYGLWNGATFPFIKDQNDLWHVWGVLGADVHGAASRLFFGKGVSEFSCYFTFTSPCFWWVLFVCRQKTSKAWNTPCTPGCEEGSSPEAQERAFAVVFTSSLFAEKASAQSIHSGTSAQKCRQECSRDTESSFQGRIVSARFAETVGSEVGAQTSGYGLLVLPKGMSFLFLWVVQAGSQAEASTLPQQRVP